MSLSAISLVTLLWCRTFPTFSGSETICQNDKSWSSNHTASQLEQEKKMKERKSSYFSAGYSGESRIKTNKNGLSTLK